MSATVDDVRTTPSAPSLTTSLRRVLLGRDAGIVALLAVVWLAGSVSVDKFTTANTVYFLLLDIFPILLIALPMTMVIVTHELQFAREVANEVAFIDGGVIVERGAPAHLFSAPQHERTKQFLHRLLFPF